MSRREAMIARLAERGTPWRRPKFPFFVMPIWVGLGLRQWLGLLARHRFKVHWRCLLKAGLISLLAPGNSALGAVQHLAFRRRLARAAPPADPVFILGHWRTGTTLLHELLARDPRLGFPSTYACLQPHHFLLTERTLSRVVKYLMPTRRPMDTMKLGLDRPQEDEFALMSLGAPSPYFGFAFPGDFARYLAQIDFDGLPAAAAQRWRRELRRFVRSVALREARPLVLKSPPHMARIAHILAEFPRARFVHIVRDPRAVIPSTQRAFVAMGLAYGLAYADPDALEALAFATHERLYRGFEAARALIDPARLHELRYEDLIADPEAAMARLYVHLGLGPFAPVRPAVAAYFAEQAGYRQADYALAPAVRADIEARCGPVLRRYGYGAG